MSTQTTNFRLVKPALDDVIDDTLEQLGLSAQIIDDTLSVFLDSATAEPLGTTDGSSVTYSGTLANAPLVRTTLTISAGETFTDNGDGTLTGSGVGTGTIDYATGAWSITHASTPAASIAITAAYTYRKGIVFESGAIDGGTW